jgi:hypothetical protein
VERERSGRRERGRGSFEFDKDVLGTFCVCFFLFDLFWRYWRVSWGDGGGEGRTDRIDDLDLRSPSVELLR